MPYTPPALRSPASTPLNNYFSPVPQLNGRPSLAPGSSGSRPHLPRSSTSTIKARKSSNASSTSSQDEDHKHRVSEEAVGSNLPQSPRLHPQKEGLTINTNIRQSPPPVNSASMPTGAIISPPESGNNSDSDEDEPSRLEKDEQLNELHQAVKTLGINRGGSPEPGATVSDQSGEGTKPELSSPEVRDFAITDPAQLSHGARKISHSRSSTEPLIGTPPPLDVSQACSTSDGSEEDDEYGFGVKPSLIRKKSGELVKPAIRGHNRRKVNSMPGTPTYGKKGVHFNDDIAQVRHFLQVDRPIAVSAGGSPVESYEEETEFPFGRHDPSSSILELRLGNFPRETHERQSLPVRLDKLCLSTDQKSLLGAVVVANLSFHKVVVARFTFDNWRTTSEVLGAYNGDVRQKPKDQGYDLFNFSVKLTDQTHLDKKTMFMCVRYNVAGKEFWDNNGGQNFHVDFWRRSAEASSQATQGPGTRPGLPRSRQRSSSPERPQTAPSSFLDDDFGGTFDAPTTFRFKNQPPKGKAHNTTPMKKPNASTQQFGARYDFGASLTNALKQYQAQSDGRAVGRTPGGDSPKPSSSPPQAGNQQEEPRAGAKVLARVAPSQAGDEAQRPDALLAGGKQGMDSRAYQEFVSKFCFFGSGKPASSPDKQPKAPPHQQPHIPANDGAHDGLSFMSRGNANENLQGGPGPAESQSQPQVSNSNAPGLMSPPQFLKARTSRSPSPIPVDTYEYSSGSASPSSYGYNYNHSGFLASGGPTPPAIRG